MNKTDGKSGAKNDNAALWPVDANEWFSLLSDVDGLQKALELKSQAHDFSNRFFYLAEGPFKVLLEHTFSFRIGDRAEPISIRNQGFASLALEKWSKMHDRRSPVVEEGL